MIILFAEGALDAIALPWQLLKNSEPSEFQAIFPKL